MSKGLKHTLKYIQSILAGLSHQKGMFALLFAGNLLVFAAAAKTIAIPQLPASQFADTEISTNILVNTSQKYIKAIELKFTIKSHISNSFQVAFGHDANSDGVLSVRETGVVYGWGNNRLFAEDFSSGMRHEHFVDTDTFPKTCTIKIRPKKDASIKRFSADIDGETVFTALSSELPSWLYRKEWSLMRVTRRGIGVPEKWLDCNVDYQNFCLSIR